MPRFVNTDGCVIFESPPHTDQEILDAIGHKHLKGHRVFSDGGIWGGSNPSPIGGAYAYVFLEEGCPAVQCQGEVGREWGRSDGVSNNNAEIYAAISGIHWAAWSLRNLWGPKNLTLCTDSAIALNVIRGTWKQKSVPPSLLDLVRGVKGIVAACGVTLDYTLLAGMHPGTRDLAHLGKGYKVKLGKRHNRYYAVSEHNAWCDRACSAYMQAKWGEKK